MVKFDLLCIYDVEKYFNIKITPFIRYKDEIELIYDDKLPMPAMSILNKITGLPSIIANPNIIPDDHNCQVHILSHEIGHIINSDIYVDPTTLNKVEMYKVECLADEVAAEFMLMNKEKYSIESVLDYFIKNCLVEQKILDEELKYMNLELIDNNYINNNSKLSYFEKSIEHIKFRIKNYKDDAINRMNILQNIKL